MRARACGEPHQGEDIIATVHGDDITIRGEKSAVESIVRMISKKVRDQEAGDREDPDLEKSGRIRNRVIKWNHNGITIEADHRDVREILRSLELERTNQLRLHVAWRGWVKARERVGADRNRPKLSTSRTMQPTVMTGTDREW